MKLIITTIFGALISLNAYALDITLNGNDSITINMNNHIKKLDFDTVINGYVVKCSGEKLIIWGKPKVINEGNPQDTNVIIVDLVHGYTRIEKGVGEGVFHIDFIKNKSYAYVETNQGLFLNLINGRLSSASPEFDPTDESNFEQCKKNSSWEFNRYP
ncbi:hypothetical protein [Enterobacter cloacae]|uniref:hypothetical protein n=1 Tax=Enterobacter cloacae TaxID=550 RepID=UPI000B8D032F|nr:hypothetical protein [Enterobacter cloacae]OXU39672.1 hypothetical protein BME83_05130 [Enterobacter cloacae subsp. cloacae]